MQIQTMNLVLGCLLDVPNQDPIAVYAKQIGMQMCRKEKTSGSLEPIFARLNGYAPGWSVPCTPLDHLVHLPQKENASVSVDTNTLLQKMEQEISAENWNESNLNALLGILERYGSVVSNGAPDLSVYDERKLSASIAACVNEYQSTQTTAFDASTFSKEKAFLLYTADFSGIQKFIYTVPSSGALRTLRSRSFFLELTMEHYIDEILSYCGVSRVNLLYSGGGHCYILLPNTKAVKEAAAAWNKRFNDWLIEYFGVQLYLADGWSECSIDDLQNIPASEAPYKKVFRRASAMIAQKKVHRYTPKQLMRLNTQETIEGTRECHVCGTQSRLVRSTEEQSVCRWCFLFAAISRHIQGGSVVTIHRTDNDYALTLPTLEGIVSVGFRDEETAYQESVEPTFVRAYVKNKTLKDLPYSISLMIADYAQDMQVGDMAKAARGIERAAVCRMDVDSLGQAFVSGFEQKNETDLQKRYHYVTLARTSAFSRQISLFFKTYLNAILSGEYGNLSRLTVTVVYSGGDDVFLVGSWNDVIEAALRIRNIFTEYTCGKLTLSAGIVLFDHSYPIRLAAMAAAELEAEAKDQQGKNTLSLFGTNNGHIYQWDVYEKDVVGEKLAELSHFFDSEETEKGMAFLHHLLSLLMQTEKEPKKGIALARLAYLLARMEPSSSETAYYTIYQEFSDRVYHWAMNAEDRRKLITAIQIFSYYNRKT